MTEGKELAQKVHDWVNSQGYLLELYTARAFREYCSSVSLAVYYTDPETGDRRETDVVASATVSLNSGETSETFFSLDIEYYIECKFSRKSPWVVFCFEDSNTEFLQWHRHNLLTSTLFSKLLDEIRWPGYRGPEDIPIPELLSPRQYAYGVAQALKTEKGEDVTYKALHSCTKAVLAAVTAEDQEYLRETNLQSNFQILTLYIPVIVVDGDLFEYSYNLDGQATVSPVPYYPLLWRSVGYRGKTPLVYIVTKEGLGKFLDECDKVRAYLAAFLPGCEKSLARIHEEIKPKPRRISFG